MRIGIQTWGSEGDLRPFFALGQGLVARGHEVTLAYTSVEGRDYSPLAAACGVRPVDAGSEGFRKLPAPELDQERAILAGSQLHQFRWAIEHLLEPAVEPMWAAHRALDPAARPRGVPLGGVHRRCS